MRFLSLFSGIEAASVAWKPLGWECVAFAEIAPFPSALLAHYYPDVPNLGNVEGIDAAALARLGPIDLVVGGFPCQDLSVAGQRKGLEHGGSRTRSGLFWEALRIANLCGARWTVLENVPGLFSSNGGRDFGVVVGSLAGCEFDVPDGGWRNAGVAAGPDGLVEWASLDAQFFHVAQRRERVFLVRDSGAWASRSPVLLEPSCLRGDPAPSREAGARVAGCLDGGAHGGGFDDNDARAWKCVDVAPALTANTANTGFDGLDERVVAHVLQDGRGDRNGDLRVGVDQAHTLHSAKGPSEQQIVAFNSCFSNQGLETELSPTLAGRQMAAGPVKAHHQGGGTGPESTYVPVSFNWQNGGGYGDAHDGLGVTEDGTPPMSRSQVSAVASPGVGVRRLTPRECERLQGFPDDYTLVPYRGKPAKDGPRYQALGNSMAVPVIAWLGRRIQAVEAIA